MILKGFFYLISFIKDNQNLYRSRGTIFLLKKIKIDVIMRTIAVILGMKISYLNSLLGKMRTHPLKK